ERDDVRHAIRGGFVDGGPQRLLEALVVFFAIQRLLNRTAWPQRIHGRRQPVFLESRPIGGPDQIESFDAQASGLATAVVQTHLSREDSASDALFDAALPRYGPLCLQSRERRQHQRSRKGAQKISSTHS